MRGFVVFCRLVWALLNGVLWLLSWMTRWAAEAADLALPAAPSSSSPVPASSEPREVIERRRSPAGHVRVEERELPRSSSRPPRVGGVTRSGIRVLVVAGVVVALVVAVGASAFWSASGSGSGGASVGSTSALTLSTGTVPAASFLYPGGTGKVVLTVNNPNGVAVEIPELALNTSAGNGGFRASGCTIAQANLTFSASPSTLDHGGLGWTVPANASAFEIDLADAVSMGADAADACQNATFSVYLKVGP